MNDLIVMVEAFGVLCFVAAVSAGALIAGWYVVRGKRKP